MFSRDRLEYEYDHILREIPMDFTQICILIAMDCYKVMKINSTLKDMGVIRKIMYLSGNLLQVKHLALYGIWRWYTILNNYIIMIQRHNNYQRAVIPNFAICTYPLAICISLFSLGLSIQIVYILNMKWSVILVIYICNFIFVLSKITILY